MYERDTIFLFFVDQSLVLPPESYVLIADTKGRTVEKNKGRCRARGVKVGRKGEIGEKEESGRKRKFMLYGG